MQGKRRCRHDPRASRAQSGSQLLAHTDRQRNDPPFSIVEHAKTEPVRCPLPVDVGGVDVVSLAIAKKSNASAGNRPVAERCTLRERQIVRLVAEDIEERTRRRVVIVSSSIHKDRYTPCPSECLAMGSDGVVIIAAVVEEDANAECSSSLAEDAADVGIAASHVVHNSNTPQAAPQRDVTGAVAIVALNVEHDAASSSTCTEHVIAPDVHIVAAQVNDHLDATLEGTLLCGFEEVGIIASDIEDECVIATIDIIARSADCTPSDGSIPDDRANAIPQKLLCRARSLEQLDKVRIELEATDDGAAHIRCKRSIEVFPCNRIPAEFCCPELVGVGFFILRTQEPEGIALSIEEFATTEKAPQLLRGSAICSDWRKVLLNDALIDQRRSKERRITRD